MIDQYESGRKSLQQLNAIFKNVDVDKFNEAKTRLQFIDSILTNCLGWDVKDIDPEDSYDGNYSDYKLKLFRPVAVWEAKRAGNYFELPIGIKNIYLPLKTLCKDNKNLKEALRQVSGYCHERGLQIGVVSNGWQIVAFLANRNDSIPPLEGSALVVPNLDVFEESYKEIWNCLSKPGLQEKYLLKKPFGRK